MAHISEDVVDSNELSNHDDDPGAYPFPFEKFAGKRLDAVPNGLRRRATQAHFEKNSWHPAYIKANKRYEELLLRTPEAYPFPFGDHKDKRLDEVPEGIIWWGIHPSRSHNVWHQNLADAHRLYLDKVYDQKSPGSVTMWFGEYKGHKLDDVYKHPGFVSSRLEPEHVKCCWYYKFKDLVQRYEMHLKTHQRPYRPRAPARVENPTGQLLGKLDDGRGSVEPDDDYERDGFVVDDDEKIFQEDSSDFAPVNNTNDPAVDTDSGGHDKEEHANCEPTENSDADRSVAQAEGSHASANISQTSGSDPDDDIPLDELRNKTVIKRLSDGGKTKVTCSNNRRRICHSSSGEETETADQPPLKRLRRRSEHEVHTSAKTDSHSDVDEPEASHHHQLSQSLRALSLTQESAGSPDNDDELPHAPRKSLRLQGTSLRRDDDLDIPEHDTYMHTLSHLGRRYRAPVQSDAEE